MDWAHIAAYVTGTVDQELLARNEYRATENRMAARGRISVCRVGTQISARRLCQQSTWTTGPRSRTAGRRRSPSRRTATGAGPRDRVAQLVKALCCRRQARRCYGGSRPVGRHQEEAVRAARCRRRKLPDLLLEQAKIRDGSSKCRESC
jgi:hypothetical protein